MVYGILSITVCIYWLVENNSMMGTGSVETIRTRPGMAKTWSRPQTKHYTNFGSESYSGTKPVVAGSSPAGREQL